MRELNLTPNFWSKFFDFFERVLPGLLAALGLGYKLGTGKVEGLVDEMASLKVEKELLENRIKENEANSGKSNSDVIDDAIRKGRGF